MHTTKEEVTSNQSKPKGETMFTYHYLRPENLWGVFDPGGNFVSVFATANEAREYCNRHNGK